ncbi:MAG TPA: hypothetical protein VF897_22370 [Roseiflexaceae bacterium]
MSFDSRDIRRAMDVYTRDNVYLGTVLDVVPDPASVVEEQVAATALQHSIVSGELLGPAPTQPIGNHASRAQSASELYATAPDAAQPLGRGTIVVGRWWGLAGKRTIPIDDVQTVSLERVVLKKRRDELDKVTR